MRHVYLIQADGDFYKVGIANDYKARLSSLQSGNHAKLRLVCARMVDNADRVESNIHRYLQKYRTAGGSEWFRLEPKVALDVASMIFDTTPNSTVMKVSDEQLCISAMELFSRTGKASTSSLQRHLGVGYGRASRIMDLLEMQGQIAPRRQFVATEVLAQPVKQVIHS